MKYIFLQRALLFTLTFFSFSSQMVFANFEEIPVTSAEHLTKFITLGELKNLSETSRANLKNIRKTNAWRSNHPKPLSFKLVDHQEKLTDSISIVDENISSLYSINLTWINNVLDINQPYIFPAKDALELSKNYLEKFKKWCHLNPQDGGGTVNIWYDSILTTPEAVQATEKELWGFPIKLRDTRSIPKIRDNRDVFSDKIPVYFRADLARVIISEHEIITGSTRCFIFAQCNMEPISKQQLFDSLTIKSLKRFGLVMAYSLSGVNYSSGFENGFFMLSGDNHIMLEAINKTLIQGCLRVAKLALDNRELFNFYMNDKDHHEDHLNFSLPQFVYGQYSNLFAYFYVKSLNLTLGQWCSNGEFEKLGDDIDDESYCSARFTALESSKLGDALFLRRFFIPIKLVFLPAAKLNYNSYRRGNDSRNYTQ